MAYEIHLNNVSLQAQRTKMRAYPHPYGGGYRQNQKRGGILITRNHAGGDQQQGRQPGI